MKRLVLAFALLIGTATAQINTLRLARETEDRGDWINALHLYLRHHASNPHSKKTIEAIQRVHRKFFVEAYHNIQLLETEPQFASYAEFQAWVDTVYNRTKKKNDPRRYLPLLAQRGITVDTSLGSETSPTHEAAYQRFLSIRTKWERIFADDYWVKATALAAQNEYRAAYQEAIMALHIRPELAKESAFDSLWALLQQHPVKLAIMPFEDATFKGNGLHRQLFTRLLAGLDSLNHPLLEHLDGSYLGLRGEQSEGDAPQGLVQGLRLGRSQGADFAVMGRLVRVVDGLEQRDKADRTAYAPRTVNDKTVYDRPVTYYDVTAQRDHAFELECELIDLRTGAVVEREAFLFTHTDRLSYSEMPGGNVNGVNFYATSQSDSKVAAVSNLLSIVAEVSTTGARQRSFSAPRQFGPHSPIYDRARDEFTAKLLDFVQRATLPRD